MLRPELMWGIQLLRRMNPNREALEGADSDLGTSICAEGAGTGTFSLAFGRRIAETQPMSLEIQIKRTLDGARPGAITVEIAGTLDSNTAPDLEAKLAPILGGSVTDLVFDLAQLRFISSAGLRVMLDAHKRVKGAGGQASFVNMQPQIKEVFAIIKALPGVAVFQNMAELDAYLARRQQQHQ